MKRKTAILSVLSVLSVLGLGTAAIAGPGHLGKGKRAIKPIPVSSIDTNGDGMVSGKELHAVMKTLRAKRQAARKAKRAAMITQWDANNDGKLDKRERALIRASRFAKLDANGDDGVSVAEAAGTRLEKRFTKIDADGNGLITEAEMAAMHKRMKGRRGKRKGKRGKRGKRGAVK